MPKQTQTNTPQDDYDNPWKEAIEEYFKECLALFFPDIHADIDWKRGYRFLDKELAKVTRQATVTDQRVDKLAEVYRLSGDTAWVALHIDVQSQHETNFATRMFTYNYRLTDRYNRPVVTLVILADSSRKWRPNKYTRDLWGCKVSFEFPTVKLIDYNEAELEQSDNPFAIVVLAHLYTKQTKHDAETRYDFKWRLTRMLYERGYTKERILSLYRYIDWLLALPPYLEEKLQITITEYEETQKMPYMTNIERMGYNRGIEEGVAQGMEKGLQSAIDRTRRHLTQLLTIRFGTLSPALEEAITRTEQLDRLDMLFDLAATVDSLEQFSQHLQEDSPNDQPTD